MKQLQLLTFLLLLFVLEMDQVLARYDRIGYIRYLIQGPLQLKFLSTVRPDQETISTVGSNYPSVLYR